jgi:hypothetical protein
MKLNFNNWKLSFNSFVIFILESSIFRLKYIYVIYRLRGPYWKKYFPEFSEAARGRRPRDASEAEGKYFLVRTDLNGKYGVYFFIW